MPRHDFGFDAFANSVDELEQAVRDAASRISHGDHPRAAELVEHMTARVRDLAAGLRHDGPVSAHVEGHLNDAHPGDGTQPDELLVAVRCAHPLPPTPMNAAQPSDVAAGSSATAQASPVDEAQPSQPATVAPPTVGVVADDRDASQQPGVGIG